MTFSKGDSVIITCQDETAEGEIAMVSESGFALMVRFESLLAGHVGMMPVLRDDDGVYRTVIGGTEVIIRRKLHA